MGQSHSSSYAYLSKSKVSRAQEAYKGGIQAPMGAIPEEGVDTNVFSLRFSMWQMSLSMATGDPVRCYNCNCYLNAFSTLSKKVEKEEEGFVKLEKEAPNERLWNCEFCFWDNTISLEEEEIPKQSTVTYFLEQPVKPMELGEESKVKEEIMEDNSMVIFCIDISGSMCLTKPAKTKTKYSEHGQYISRLEMVKLAIDAQINEMSRSHPYRKVGFVVFGNDVTIYGDGTEKPVALKGELLDNYSQLVDMSLTSGSKSITKPVKESCPFLLEKLKIMETGGITALGPGLLASVSIAGSIPGSKVILCTDGIANKGLGGIEGIDNKPEKLKATADFYEKVGEFAKSQGVGVSVISIVEDECKLEMLSSVANLTGGDVLRVDPQKLSEDFADFLEEEIIATNTTLRVQLHKGMEFRNEKEENLEASKSVANREVGNATASTEITFEYKIKSVEELKQMEEIDFEKMECLPFQVCITYKRKDGGRCVTVITEQKKVTMEEAKAVENADMDILQVNAAQRAAQMAEVGDYEEAKRQVNMWGGMMQGAEAQGEYADNVGQMYSAIEGQERIMNKKHGSGKRAHQAAMAGDRGQFKFDSADHFAKNVNYGKHANIKKFSKNKKEKKKTKSDEEDKGARQSQN